jgi:hypothetical protein
MPKYVGIDQDKKAKYLSLMLTKINLTIIIRPFSIPQGAPVPITKNQK